MHLTNGNATQATSTSGLAHQPQQKTSDADEELSEFVTEIESHMLLRLVVPGQYSQQLIHNQYRVVTVLIPVMEV